MFRKLTKAPEGFPIDDWNKVVKAISDLWKMTGDGQVLVDVVHGVPTFRLKKQLVKTNIWGWLTEELSQGDSAEMAIGGFDESDEQIDTGDTAVVWDATLNVGDDPYPQFTRGWAWWDYTSNRYVWGVGNCEAEDEENLPEELSSGADGGSPSDPGDDLDGGSPSAEGDSLDGGSP